MPVRQRNSIRRAVAQRPEACHIASALRHETASSLRESFNEVMMPAALSYMLHSVPTCSRRRIG